MPNPNPEGGSFAIKQFELLSATVYRCKHCKKQVKTSKETKTNLNRHIKVKYWWASLLNICSMLKSVISIQDS